MDNNEVNKDGDRWFVHTVDGLTLGTMHKRTKEVLNEQTNKGYVLAFLNHSVVQTNNQGPTVFMAHIVMELDE